MPKLESTHLTVKLAAESIHVSVETILSWIASGELRAANISRSNIRPRWRISKDDLAALMKRRSTKQKNKQRKRRQKKTSTQYV